MLLSSFPRTQVPAYSQTCAHSKTVVSCHDYVVNWKRQFDGREIWGRRKSCSGGRSLLGLDLGAGLK